MDYLISIINYSNALLYSIPKYAHPIYNYKQKDNNYEHVLANFFDSTSLHNSYIIFLIRIGK